WGGALPPRRSPIDYAQSNNTLLRRPVEYGQFRSRKLRRELAAHNLVGSMGRVASCGDCQSVVTDSRKDEEVPVGAV
ncbi:hypothetical protein M3B43_11395, partial [Nesterenkonia massiliensis]